ncbi:MAG: hypothetical protein ACWA5W_08575, partial [Phycisphaerales bacterium]
VFLVVFFVVVFFEAAFLVVFFVVFLVVDADSEVDSVSGAVFSGKSVIGIRLAVFSGRNNNTHTNPIDNQPRLPAGMGADQIRSDALCGADALDARSRSMQRPTLYQRL